MARKRLRRGNGCGAETVVLRKWSWREIFLADEPTGNLDAQSAKDVMVMPQKLNKDFGKTIIIVTQARHAAEYATMIRHLEKGELKPEIEYPQA